jgi:hypothetical protein
MAAARKAAAASAPPVDLASKRPALVTAREDTDADLLKAEVEGEEQLADDGSCTVKLVTEFGEALITVPPLSSWRSVARNALFTKQDDLTWAARTLSTEDATTWMDLDPTQAESSEFFERWGRVVGVAMGKLHASHPSRP